MVHGVDSFEPGGIAYAICLEGIGRVGMLSGVQLNDWCSSARAISAEVRMLRQLPGRWALMLYHVACKQLWRRQQMKLL